MNIRIWRRGRILGVLLALVAATACSSTSATPGASVAATPGASSGSSADAGKTPAPRPRAAWKPGQTVLDFVQVSAQAGWVETNRGVWQTVDGGATWADATPRRLLPGTIRDLAALDADRALLSVVDVAAETTTYHILRTIDGGASWADVALPPVPHDPICTGAGCSGNKPGDPPAPIDYVDASTAFVWFGISRDAGLTNYVFGTKNGGATWTALPYDPPTGKAAEPIQIQFDTAAAGIAESGHVISSTTSGWGAWTHQTVAIGYFAAPPVYFLDSTHWYADVGLDYGSPTAYRYLLSGDQGKSWAAHTVAMPSIGATAVSVSFFSPSVWNATVNTPLAKGLYGVNGPAFTYVTKDGGARWTLTGEQPASASLAFWLDPDTGWAFGTGKLWSTSDAGATWRLLTP